MIKLKYTGGGFGGSLQGIPARDLTNEEVKKHGGVKFLLSTGLYKKVEEIDAPEEVPGGDEIKES